MLVNFGRRFIGGVGSRAFFGACIKIASCAWPRGRLLLGCCARGLLAIPLFLALCLTAHAARKNELFSTEELRVENDAFNKQGLAAVDPFSGNLTSASRDVHLPGNGGNDISVFRRYDASRLKSQIWGDEIVRGASHEKFMPQEFAAFGPPDGGRGRYGAWSLTAGPMVHMNVSAYPVPDMPEVMSDNVDRVCMQVPFRQNGNSGAYGIIVVYSLVLPDGQTEDLVPIETGVVQTRSGWRMTCVGGIGGTHILRSPAGDRYTLGRRVWSYSVENFDSVHWAKMTALTTRMDDSNGNWIDYSYTDLPEWHEEGFLRNRLVAITSSDGRRLDFDYMAFSTGGASVSRLWRIRSGAGASWQYTYDASGQLASFGDAAGRIWSYQYYPRLSYPGVLGSGDLVVPGGGTHAFPDWAKSSALKTITLPTGGVISLDYRPSEVLGSGLWSWQSTGSAHDINMLGEGIVEVRANWALRVHEKRTSDGGIWRYSYVPARTRGAYDETRIETPAGLEIHKFIGEGYFVDASVWAQPGNYNAFDYPQTLIRDAWKLGLPVEVRKGDVWLETYEWQPHLHSDIWLLATSGFVGLRDEKTYRPLLSRRTVNVGGAVHTTVNSNFDTHGNPQLITETGPNGGSRTTTVSYYNDTAKWIIGVRKDESFSGGSITRSFDANGNLSSLSQDGVTTSYTYDASGNLATQTLPRGLVHSYSNYKRGIAQTESQPEGVAISRTVNDAGDITSETNGEGKITSFTHDGIGRLTSVTYPVGNPKSVNYSANSSSATRGSLVESRQLDGFGRPTSVTLGGVSKTFAYDSLGRMTFESNPGNSGQGTSYQYDILDRVTRITNADTTFQTIAYGPSTKSVTDERERTTTYSYRSYGEPTQQLIMGITAPEAAASITIERNPRDVITSVTQDGKTRSYGYNANYYLTSVTQPETGVTTYGRDAAGNMISRSIGSSGTTSYVYDGQNRLASVTYPGSTPAVTQTYNKVHKMRTANSSAGNRSFIYDDNGNLTNESLLVDGQTFTAAYGYNANDQLSSTTYPRSNRVVQYAPDVLGRPTQVSGYVNSVSYWPSGQIKQITYANGTQTNYGQNARMWPSQFNTQKAGGATYMDSAYSYDGVGNLQSIVDSIDAHYSRGMQYDGINRLTGINGPWGSGTISYDGLGNIRSQVLGSSSLDYTYDGSNRLSGVSGARSASYGYDAQGNITSGAGNTYTYDGVPNLRCINCANAATKIEYAYDGGNQRAMVTKAGVKTYEMYGAKGQQLIEFTPSQSNKLVEYFYLDGKRIAQRATTN